MTASPLLELVPLEAWAREYQTLLVELGDCCCRWRHVRTTVTPPEGMDFEQAVELAVSAEALSLAILMPIRLRKVTRKTA